MKEQVDTVKTHLWLPADVHQKLKDLSRQSSIPMVQIVTILIRRTSLKDLPQDAARQIIGEALSE